MSFQDFRIPLEFQIFSSFRLLIEFIYLLSAISLFQGLKGLMALDTIGILLRWKIFDHAAHLGGALFGM